MSRGGTYDERVAERHGLIRVLRRSIGHTPEIQPELGVEEIRVGVVSRDDDEGEVGSTGLHLEEVGHAAVGLFEDGAVGCAADLMGG